MQRKICAVLYAILYAVLMLFLAGFVSSDRILRLADKSVQAVPAVLKELADARLVFVGEFHDNQDHHAAQLLIIQGLKGMGRAVAIGLEMFEAGQQQYLDKWTTGEIAPEEFVKIYYDNWRMPWPLYKDIFFYARDKRIPMVGLNVPAGIVNQIARRGFASLSGEQLANLPGVSCEIDETYENLIRRVLRGHYGHADKLNKNFKNFCEAQLTWDSAMAWHLIKFLDRHPDLTVVVLAGGSHAWKHGIPAQIRRRSQYSFKVILPESDGLARGEVSGDEADYLWLGL